MGKLRRRGRFPSRPADGGDDALLGRRPIADKLADILCDELLPRLMAQVARRRATPPASRAPTPTRWRAASSPAG